MSGRRVTRNNTYTCVFVLIDINFFSKNKILIYLSTVFFSNHYIIIQFQPINAFEFSV